MGIFNAVTNHAHKSELRESKDEIVVGELIRSLSHRGWICYRLTANSDRQMMTFKLPDDEVLSEVTIVVDRRTGSGAVSAALGSRSTVALSAAIRNKTSDPDDLAAMWKTDLANLFKIPVAGEVKVDHQLNKVIARTHHVINLDDYVQGSEVRAGELVPWVVGQVDNLREHLRPHKR